MTDGTLALVGAALFVVLVGAGWLALTGLRARAQARATYTENARLALLLRGAPAQVATVRVDGRLEMPARVAAWFGLAEPPEFLTDLDPALEPDDASGLAADVRAARLAGRSFARAVRPRGAERTLAIRGDRAPGGTGQGDVALWIFDATEREAEIARLRAEVAMLRTSGEELSDLIDKAPLPIWYRHPDMKFGVVNKAYVDAVEARDAAEVIERGIELVETTGAGGPLDGAMAARDTGQTYSQVLPATIGGARRALRLFDVPLPMGGIAGFAFDIEELEQSRVSSKRFADAQRVMLDRLSAAVAQFGADRGLVFCNQPFKRMFAMRSEWVADRPEFDRVLERMREANRLPEVRDFPGWKAERREWFTAADSAVEEAWHLSGGTHLRVVAQPLPDGGLLLIFEDRTEQVQLASARDTLLRVRTATFDNLFEAMAVFGADGRLQLWNNRLRAVWGFEEEFLSTHPRVDAFAQAAAPKLATPNRSALIGELVRSATVERQQRGGRVAFADGRHFEFAAVPLPDGNALFTMLDITDSRKIERALRERAEALEAADKVKTAFVANMSYELRTPLTSISGFAEMLHSGYAGPLSEQGASYVEAILDSVERLGLLIDDVLDLTQGAADGAVKREDVDLASVTRAAAETVLPAAKRRKLDFAVEVARTTGRVTGDPRRLREVVEHLLRHAVSSTPEGGRVLLHADGDGRRARIVVSDNGPGMDEAAVESAFERFAEPGIQPSGERALGLGLPLAKQFVEAHGGTIKLVSEVGEGTLVTVELPRR